MSLARATPIWESDHGRDDGVFQSVVPTRCLWQGPLRYGKATMEGTTGCSSPSFRLDVFGKGHSDMGKRPWKGRRGVPVRRSDPMSLARATPIWESDHGRDDGVFQSVVPTRCLWQ